LVAPQSWWSREAVRRGCSWPTAGDAAAHPTTRAAMPMARTVGDMPQRLVESPSGLAERAPDPPPKGRCDGSKYLEDVAADFGQNWATAILTTKSCNLML